MTHPFIHIGDIHLSPNARQADRLAALDQVVEYGLGLDYLAAWLIPGDIFHAKSTIADRNAMAERLKRMCVMADVFLVPGNHDAPGDLDILEFISDRGHSVYVIDRPRTIRFKVGRDQAVVVGCLPYPHRAAYVAEGASPDEVTARGGEALDEYCRKLGAELFSAHQYGAITLAIGHANVAGAVSSVGQPQIGQEIELTAAAITKLNVGYVGLNHIHKHQEIGGAVFAGSICRLDFGENEPKGFIVATYDDANKSWAWEFRELDVPQQFLVNGAIRRHGFEFDTKADVDATMNCKGADVRVRYRYDRADAVMLDAQKAIRPLFASARSLKLEGIPEHIAEVRAPEIAAAKTLIEKVQAYCTRMNIEWTDGIAAKVSALQAAEHQLESRVA